MDKPVLIGMNNPYGTDPKFALYPYPERSAGGRLHAMFRAAFIAKGDVDPNTPTRQRYIDGFDRRNVLNAMRWDTHLARRQGRELLRELEPGSRVVVLGRKTADALGIMRTEWFERSITIETYDSTMVKYYTWTIPHPSGMCQEYNDPAVRKRAGELLLALYEGRDP